MPGTLTVFYGLSGRQMLNKASGTILATIFVTEDEAIL